MSLGQVYMMQLHISLEESLDNLILESNQKGRNSSLPFLKKRDQFMKICKSWGLFLKKIKEISKTISHAGSYIFWHSHAQLRACSKKLHFYCVSWYFFYGPNLRFHFQGAGKFSGRYESVDHGRNCFNNPCNVEKCDAKSYQRCSDM